MQICSLLWKICERNQRTYMCSTLDNEKIRYVDNEKIGALSVVYPQQVWNWSSSFGTMVLKYWVVCVTIFCSIWTCSFLCPFAICPGRWIGYLQDKSLSMQRINIRERNCAIRRLNNWALCLLSYHLTSRNKIMQTSCEQPLIFWIFFFISFLS